MPPGSAMTARFLFCVAQASRLHLLSHSAFSLSALHGPWYCVQQGCPCGSAEDHTVVLHV